MVSQSHFDVLVLGAGITGIAAAVEIAKAGGLRAVVLEARARIGGRLLTSLPDGLPCPPGPFDLGGAWLTGLDGNPLVPLCDELGVRMRSAGRAPQESDVVEAPSDAFYISTGERISQEDIDKAEDGLPRLYTRIRSEFSAPDRSLADAIALLRAKAEKEGDPIDKFTFHLLESNTELNEGASTRELSSEAFEPVGGGEFGADYELIDGGFALVPQKWAEKEKVDVRLGEPVEKVAWDESDDGGVTFCTRGGKVYKAKAVIVTAPFTVVRSGNILFEPPLPQAHLAALSKFQCGTLSKLILIFHQRFWSENAGDISLIPDHDEIPAIPTHFLVGSGPIGLSYPGSNLHALIAFCHGPVAQRLERETSAVIAEVIAVFRRLYGVDAVPDPQGYYATSWLSDEFSMGSYSFNGVGFDLSSVSDVIKPVGDRIWFAGEWTSVLHRGYVHGGLIEGQRAARGVLGVLNRGS